MNDERTTFEFLRGYTEEEGTRLFVKIFRDRSHIMIELSEGELADLRETLNSPPTEFNRD